MAEWIPLSVTNALSAGQDKIPDPAMMGVASSLAQSFAAYGSHEELLSTVVDEVPKIVEGDLGEFAGKGDTLLGAVHAIREVSVGFLSEARDDGKAAGCLCSEVGRLCFNLYWSAGDSRIAAARSAQQEASDFLLAEHFVLARVVQSFKSALQWRSGAISSEAGKLPVGYEQADLDRDAAAVLMPVVASGALRTSELIELSRLTPFQVDRALIELQRDGRASLFASSLASGLSVSGYGSTAMGRTWMVDWLIDHAGA